MHYIKHLPFIAIICVLLFSACEKVIDVDLNSASPKYVIEGIVTDGQSPQSVKITRTKNFDENNDFEGVDFAEVSIADDAGNSATLTYAGDGVYKTTALSGIPGKTYLLTINVGGETFTAASTMPEAAIFDSLYMEERTTFGDTVKVPHIKFSDPSPGKRNYYRHSIFINNTKLPNIIIGTDEGRDGQQSQRRLPVFRGGEEEALEAGDTVRVEIQSIGKEVYEYFFSLDQTISQDAATPANPVSNITGGALGYFSAHSVQAKTIVVE